MNFHPRSLALPLAACAAICVVSCSSASSKARVSEPVRSAEPAAPTIKVEANGPADTVRTFYKLLREGKFQHALFLTNLRPAIEGLTGDELKDLAVDFEAIAGEIPAEIEINGEIISGERATVTAKLPTRESDEPVLQSVKLRKTGDAWIILTVDESAEEKIRADGKQYFYNLRIETHEDEAKRMLERISKAQTVHSMQNGGTYTDMPTLIAAKLLPEDAQRSAGYKFAIDLAADKKNYSSSAVPIEHGKSGRRSFLLKLDEKGVSRVTSRDNGGKPITN